MKPNEPFTYSMTDYPGVICGVKIGEISFKKNPLRFIL